VTITVASFPDPSDPDGKWVSVKVKPVRKLERPVTLAAIKAEPRLANCELVRLSRLSVCEFTPEEWQIVLAMAEG
jgi:predicted RNA-binding protein with PUA-like domain